MLNGRFENCYGLKTFTMPNINFARSNRALIYAPNGVMKSSLAKVFEDISKGTPTSDRIFTGDPTIYSVTHYTSQYNFNSATPPVLTPTDRIYVVNTFTNSFEFTKETVSTLLADETTRNTYNVLIERFQNDIKQIVERLHDVSGLTKPQIKDIIAKDFDVAGLFDWTDIFEKIHEHIAEVDEYDFFDEVPYSALFNDKVMSVYTKPAFISSIAQYVSELNNLLSDNPILSESFNDHSAESLGKALKENNIFSAQHTIHLKDGVTIIHNIDEWNAKVKEQLDIVYSRPEVSTVFATLKKLLNANGETRKLKEIISNHREIIPLLSDIPRFKVKAWLYYFTKLDRSFDEYYTLVSQYTEEIHGLYEQASAQSQRWSEVVEEFNRRFRVPFKVKIENKAGFLLKDEAPNLTFDYMRGTGANQQVAPMKKDQLLDTLSTGERRALYLLYILFDLEKIRQRASSGGGQFLIVADDIADSFDYKNKYAIIEYLNDLAQTPGIDLLVLTHNFDFYRTVKLRLGVQRPNCYIAQRSEDGAITMNVFRYQKDFFKQVIIEKIKTGVIDTDEKKKLLISSIPFYRNLCEYSGDDNDYLKLTSFLHLKTTPIDTGTVMLSDLWNIINKFIPTSPTFSGGDEKYIDALIRIADLCVADNNSEVILENKLVISIAIRQRTEKFLKDLAASNGLTLTDSDSNQTRDWGNLVSQFLTGEQKSVLDEVNLITPENIHLNSFMYEPIIDISDWSLKQLYNDVKSKLV
ncbi:MAG: AAA family ATPase [Clostridia bacterium]|nr:AAA family ATPase [Clostridia bacterium]